MSKLLRGLKKRDATSRVNRRYFLVHRLVILLVFFGVIGQKAIFESIWGILKDTDELGLPTSQLEDLDEYGYMAACLYVNDENHRLLEWIPYHYYVVGVRRIIITNTPHSTSTPRPVLDLWNDRINITLWNENGPSDFPLNMNFDHDVHLQNQYKFLTKCHQTLKREGWNWTFHIDPDEYLVINDRVRKPGNELYHLNISSTELIIPSQREASSIPKLLKRLEPFRNNSSSPFLHTRPCLQYARKQFSSKPTTHSDNSSNILDSYVDNITIGIDTKQMNTFRWLWWGYPPMLVGKGIGDLSRVSYQDLERFQTPHFPFGNKSLCVDDDKWLSEEKSHLLIHHYPASWSELMARKHTPWLRKYGNDGGVKGDNMTAHAEERHKQESRSDGKMVIGIQDWLPGFIDFVGTLEAERLLQHVGNLTMAKRGANIAWGVGH